MKKTSADYSALRHFEAWLSKNRDRFKIAPKIIKKGKQGLSLHYDGITPVIEPHLSQRDSYISLSICIRYRRIIWDLITDFEVLIKHNKSGYFCDLCIYGPREYFKTIEALMEKHCFEEFRTWSNKRIRMANSLALFGSPKGSTAAFIRTPAQIKKLSDTEYRILPLLYEKKDRFKYPTDKGKAAVSVRIAIEYLFVGFLCNKIETLLTVNEPLFADNRDWIERIHLLMNNKRHPLYEQREKVLMAGIAQAEINDTLIAEAKYKMKIFYSRRNEEIDKVTFEAQDEFRQMLKAHLPQYLEIAMKARSRNATSRKTRAEVAGKTKKG